MKTFLLLLLTFLIAACGGREPIGELAPATPAQMTVPTPQAMPLAMGGSVDLATLPGASLSSPADPAWVEVPAHRIELTLAPPVHPSVNLRHEPASPPVPVTLQAATDGEQLYLRLRWPDASADRDTSRNLFADGAAVQFALAGGDQTSFMMGAPNAAVNLWYWRADLEQPQNLAAAGFGSTTTLARGELQSSALHLDSGEWVLVFSRPLAVDGEYQVDLTGAPVHIGLATWQGNEEQRDGLKHVTMGWLALGGAS